MVGPVPTYLLTVAYDGTNFHGWQRQPGVRTVQEELEKACVAIDLGGTHVEGAGRTDTGVHAFGQCAHIKIEREFPADKLQLALNSNLPEDVAVRRAILAPDAFHARFFAGGKRYLYRVVCSPVKPRLVGRIFTGAGAPSTSTRCAARCSVCAASTTSPRSRPTRATRSRAAPCARCSTCT